MKGHREESYSQFGHLRPWQISKKWSKKDSKLVWTDLEVEES